MVHVFTIFLRILQVSAVRILAMQGAVGPEGMLSLLIVAAVPARVILAGLQKRTFTLLRIDVHLSIICNPKFEDEQI